MTGSCRARGLAPMTGNAAAVPMSDFFPAG
jgi:hypothetical protein